MARSKAKVKAAKKPAPKKPKAKAKAKAKVYRDPSTSDGDSDSECSSTSTMELDPIDEKGEGGRVAPEDLERDDLIVGHGLYTPDECPKEFKGVGEVLEGLRELEGQWRQLSCSRNRKLPTIPKGDLQLLTTLYSHMLDTFAKGKRFAKRYEKSGHDKHIREGLTMGCHVPSYFANVRDGQSMFYRKLVSMAGLQNLVESGVLIYTELRDALFVGNPQKYGNKGINRMRNLTGNVVDLDSLVLRPREVLGTVNALRKKDGLPEFDDEYEFADSQEAMDMAIRAADPILTAFGDQLGLSQKERTARKILPPKCGTPATIATDNKERGMWPVWRYCNVGIDTYHANAPDVEDVLLSVVIAPLACARAYLACLSSDDVESSLDAFYEDCIADTCFNHKWGNIRCFIDTLRSKGTIPLVLGKIQEGNQKLFTAKFFEDDDKECSNERLEMKRLTKGLTGLDPKTRLVRQITHQDVDDWVAASL